MSKRVIEGKVYDTESATEVARKTQPGFTLYEALCLTKNSAWFLYRNPSDEFKLINPEDAFQWLCKYDEVEAANKYFPGRLQEG
jgi:hypothetical protein